MKTIAFSGSNSSKSINHQLVKYAASLQDSIELIRISDYFMPIYSMDIEEKSGIPIDVVKLHDKLSNANKLIISVCEHNGNVSAFFKNTMDWLSRHNNAFLKDIKVILLSTSPGKGGAASALALAKKMLPYFGAEIIATLSIPSFNQNFSGEGFNKETKQKVNDLLTIKNL